MGFDECIVSCIHHHIIQNSFTTPKISCSLPLMNSQQTLICLQSCLFSFAFSRMLYKWNHTACAIFILAFFTEQYALKIHSCLFFFKTSLLEYNCFTMVCQFLLYNKVNQLYIYICPHISSLLCLPPSPPPYPTPPGGHKAPS